MIILYSYLILRFWHLSVYESVRFLQVSSFPTAWNIRVSNGCTDTTRVEAHGSRCNDDRYHCTVYIQIWIRIQYIIALLLLIINNWAVYRVTFWGVYIPLHRDRLVLCEYLNFSIFSCVSRTFSIFRHISRIYCILTIAGSSALLAFFDFPSVCRATSWVSLIVFLWLPILSDCMRWGIGGSFHNI